MSRATLFGVAALAAAALWLEIVLLRFLSVAQHYHFAFLVISLALLGFGASGTLLTLAPRWKTLPQDVLYARLGWGFAGTALVAYGVVNQVPFDSYSLAWDARQALYFVLYFGVLASPFLVAGLGTGLALAAAGELSHIFYAANLLGSALGALLAPIALNLVGVPGAVLLACMIGLLAGFRGKLRWLVVPVLVAGTALLIGLGFENRSGASPLRMTISPYKGLSYALARPGSRQVFGAWSSRSRVDILAQAGNRQLPGLSYTYTAIPPAQLGVSIDGGGLQPITLADPDDFEVGDYLPESLVFQLRPDAEVLVLEPAGGLGVLQALSGGARSVLAVFGDASLREAIAESAAAYDILSHPQVRYSPADPREFLSRSQDPSYTVVFLPLTEGYQPVASGAFSLGENYTFTLEGFGAMLDRLKPGGVLVASRWLQSQPSEGLRLAALAIEALEGRGVPARESILLFRSLQTATILVSPGGWTTAELVAVRQFMADRRFDLIWAPDIRPEEVNRFNRLPEPSLYLAVRDLIQATNREAFYEEAPFEVRPPTDDQPFFAHFFRLKQTPEVLAALGKVWLPFGGSGYLVLLAMLALAAGLGGVLILGPLVFRRNSLTEPGGGLSRSWVWAYFGLLGAGFLLVEIPLIQRWILLVGSPVVAFSLVVFSLLAFSGLGSWLSNRIAGNWPVGLLAITALAAPWLTGEIMRFSLGWPLTLRVGLGLITLAPLGTLMGVPFPLGLARVQASAPALVPWAWAINGCLSVISGVLAAILALSGGFTLVLVTGAACYFVAWVLLFRVALASR